MLARLTAALLAATSYCGCPASATHILCAATSCASSSCVHASLRMSGRRWWFQRSLHCLPMRPSSLPLANSELRQRAMALQLPSPCSVTSLRTAAEEHCR